jgi:hypothetical protein
MPAPNVIDVEFIPVTEQITIAKFKSIRKAHRLIELLDGARIDTTLVKKKDTYQVRVSVPAGTEKQFLKG